MKTRVRAWIDSTLWGVVARRSRNASAGRQPQSGLVACRLRSRQGPSGHGSRDHARALQLDRGHRHVGRDLHQLPPLPDVGQDRASAMTRLVLTVVATASMAAFSEQLAHPPLTVALEKLDRYLVEDEPKLSALVADEDLPTGNAADHQHHGAPIFIAAVGIRSCAFTRLPDEKTWLGFRRVRKIDGKEIANTQPTLVALLSLGVQRSPGASTTAGDAKLGTQPRIAAHDQHAKPAARAVATEVPPALPRQRGRHWPSSWLCRITRVAV